MKPKELKNFLLQVMRKEEIPSIFIWGPPGVGKSTITRQVAQELGLDFIDIRLLQMEPTDLRGIPVPKGDRAVWLEPAILPKEGKGILFLDELNVAPPLVQNVALQLVLDRKVGEYVLPKGWRVIAAGNREGEGFVYSMPPPLLNRFIHIELKPDIDDWVDWALSNGIRPEIIHFLNKHRPELLFKFDPQKQDKAFPTPRSWELLSRLMDCLENPYKDPEIFYGAVGEGAGAEFNSYLSIWKELPDPDRILNGEDIIPTSPSLKYALITAVVIKAKPFQYPRVFNYAGKYPKEFEVFMIKLLVRKDPQRVRNLPEWGEWVKRNKELI